MRIILAFVCGILLLAGCREQKEKDLCVLQMNIWQEGTMVPNGFEAIGNEILRVNPDVVCLSEVRNYHGIEFIPALRRYLKEKGATYYGETNSTDVGILSKHKIIRQEIVYPLSGDRGSIIKAVLAVDDYIIAAYSCHLDYTHYACYLPRGYDGTTFQKLPAPIEEVDSILACNRSSKREEALLYLIVDGQKELDQAHGVIIAGDFNEPSHLDWMADTKELRDHRGLVVPWPCSLLLMKQGYKDAFREMYPDPVSNPGITYPSDNVDADLRSLAWASDSDDRERIDFIYFWPDDKLSLRSAQIMGPSGSIKNGKRVENDSNDSFWEPIDVWPSDHKAVLATFSLP
ncbi:MAG: endonuclease/exonuclease/phosphatase family protein [Parabacteroides sp.]|nr:endonuclease/exonuclease/phosphatase family protein [Parabacteroides sp.]